MRGFQPRKEGEPTAPTNAPKLGFQPGMRAAVAQAQNQAPDTVPAMMKPGEFVLPPDTVHAMGGEQALQGVVNATHTPVRGFVPQAQAAPEEPRQFFANGGLVVDDEKKRQPGIFPSNSPDAGANIYGASNKAIGDTVGKAAGFVANAFPGTTAAIKGATQDAKDAYQQGGLGAAVGQSARVAATPLIGLADDVAGSAARVLDPAANALKTFVTGDSTPIGQEGAAGASASTTPKPAVAAAPPIPAPATQTPTDQRLATEMQSTPPAAAPAASSTSNQVMPGVYEHGRGQFSDSAAGMAMPRGFTAQPSAQNLAAADALAARTTPAPGMPTARGFQPQGVAAPTVRRLTSHELRNLEVSASSITNNGGRFDPTKGNNAAQAAYRGALAADAAAAGAQATGDVAAMNANAGLQRELLHQTGSLEREALQQAGANERAARGFDIDRQRVGIEGRRADGESSVRGFQVRAAAQQEQLRGVLTDPAATAQQKAQAQAALLALNGKGDSWKAVALQGGTDAQGNKTESMLGAVNERTGEMKRMEGQGAGAVPPGMVKQVGTSGGKPVYEDANGKRFVAG